MKTAKYVKYVETEVLHVSTNTLHFFLIREFAVLDIFIYVVFVKCALCVIHICTQMVVSVYLSIHS